MTLTPQEIQSKQFHVRLRGFDVEEVDGFLEKIAEEFLILTLENKQAKEKLQELSKEIEGYKKQEKTFQTAILSAQKISEEMQAKARKESEEMLTKAREESEHTLTQARSEAEETLARANNEAEDRITSARNEAEQNINQAREQAEETVSQARDSAEETLNNARYDAERLHTETQEKVTTLKKEIDSLSTLKDKIRADLKQMLAGYMNKIADSAAVSEDLSVAEIVTDSDEKSDETQTAQVQECATEQDTDAGQVNFAVEEAEEEQTADIDAPVDDRFTAGLEEEQEEVQAALPDEDLDDLYEKITFIEATTPFEQAGEALEEEIDLTSEAREIPPELETAEAEEQNEEEEVISFDESESDDSSDQNNAFHLHALESAIDDSDLQELKIDISDLEDAAEDHASDITIPDLDGDMMFTLDDPLDDLDPGVSIAGDKHKH